MNKYYPHIFEPITIRGVTFKNRIFTAPSMSHMLQNNEPTYPEMPFIANYLQKAKGGVAMVECGGQQVNDPGRNNIHSCFDIENPKGWRNFIHLTNAIHAYDAKCSYELIHFGGEGEYTEEAKKGIIYGCSEFVRESDGLHFHQMPVEEMEKLADRYASLAKCIQFCGFDCLLIHGGHGTLLQEFLSPRSNHRTDEYGGSIENRARFPMMVLDRIREAVGNKLLIEYRISGSECVPGGFEIDECIEFFKLIQDKIDIAHISAGVVREPRLRAITHPSGFMPEAGNIHLAAAVKACPDIKIPVLGLGAFQHPDAIEKALAEGKADLIAMARGTISDPGCVNKMKEGRPEDIVPCIKCFHCLDEFKNTHLYTCAVNPTAGRETQLDRLFPAQYTKKNVGIIGGGPAGMKAAIVAAERGHTVTLFEKENVLGGQLNDADFMSFKYDLKKYKNYLIHQVEKNANITVKLGHALTPAELAEMNFDSVICAIGAEPFIPGFIPGVNGENVMWAGHSFWAPEKVGNKVVVIGGGQVGCETAVHYGTQGKDVTVLEMQASLAPDAMRTYKEELQGQVGDHCTAITGARVTAIEPNGVRYLLNGEECFVECDTVLLAMGMKPKNAEAESFRSSCDEFRPIGDCVKVGNVKWATRYGYDAAMTL